MLARIGRSGELGAQSWAGPRGPEPLPAGTWHRSRRACARFTVTAAGNPPVIGPAQDGGAAGPPGAEVGAQHDVRVEKGDESVEVAGAPCGEEGVHDRSLPGWVAFRGGDLGTVDPPPGPAGQLPGRLGRSPHQGTDLFERQVEHVGQHEWEALGRGRGSRCRTWRKTFFREEGQSPGRPARSVGVS